MERIYLVHKHYDAAHLETVKAEMLKLGAPTIKAFWDEALNAWVAVEGCHRLRAAKALSVTPVIDQVNYDSNWSDVVDDLGEADDCPLLDLAKPAALHETVYLDMELDY